MQSVVRTLICFIFTAVASLPAANVTLSWDSSPDPSVTGYHLYYGVASRAYTNKVTVGKVTTASVSGLQAGVTYYFAATAFNSANLESDYSNEVAYQIPAVVDVPCSLDFANLTQPYDGEPKQPTVLTSPAGVPVNITYDGKTTPPNAVGSYTCVAVPAVPGYSGAVTNIFVITKGLAAVTLSGLTRTYTSSGSPVEVTTSPAGLTTTVTYNGKTAVPTLPGSYKVICNVAHANYQGGATNTLVISKAYAPVTLSGLVQTYNGTARKAVATTTPAGYNVKITYAGKTYAPTNAGTYAVVATVSSQTHQGSASGALVVNRASASMSLAGLVQEYDGKPKSVSVTTTPTELPTVVTYDGLSQPPTSAGRYTVVASVNTQNYSGSVTGTLTIGDGGGVTPVPAAPANLRVVELSWGDHEADTVVYQSKDLITWEVAATVPAGANSLLLQQAEGPNFFQVVPLGSTQAVPSSLRTPR